MSSDLMSTPGHNPARVTDRKSQLLLSATRNPAQPNTLALVPSLLARPAKRYLRAEVYGVQADATFASKASNLGGFTGSCRVFTQE